MFKTINTHIKDFIRERWMGFVDFMCRKPNFITDYLNKVIEEVEEERFKGMTREQRIAKLL